MVSSINKRFRECWSEYGKLLASREYYAAFMRAANVFSCLSAVPPEIKARQQRFCDEVPVNKLILESIQNEIDHKEFRITRIMTVGTKWNEDELLFVVTTRIQNDILIGFIRYRGFNISSQSQTPLNKFLGGVHKEMFKSSIRLARKNWGLPVKHPFFDDGYKHISAS